MLDELEFAGPVVDQEHIGITFLTQFQRLSGAYGDYPDFNAGLLLEHRQQVVEQSRGLGGGGGGEGDELRSGLQREAEYEEGQK